MNDADSYLSVLQATIASFRYWVPSISDTARVTESDGSGVWTMVVRPLQRGACPFTLSLRRDAHYELEVDGVAHPRRPVESLNVFQPIAEAIAEGRLRQRRWTTAGTGALLQVETIAELEQGGVWQAAVPTPLGERVGLEDGIWQDQHYLPYRRR